MRCQHAAQKSCQGLDFMESRKFQALGRPGLMHTEASYSVAQVFIYNQSSMQYFHQVSVKLVNTNMFMFKTKVLSLTFVDK